jgi:hypothetical protein
MLLECPHCYNKVITVNGSICPSCSKDVKHVNAENENYTSLEIADAEKPPLYCFHCGGAARYIKRIVKRKSKNPIIYNSGMGMISMLLLPLGILFLSIRQGFGKKINAPA